MKKMQLSALVLDRINSQPPTQPETTTHQASRPLSAAKAKKARTPPATNTAFKSSLGTVFSSKEAYFCLFVIGVSISILCLWHLPLGKVPILQSLVQEGKREYIGLTLNIGLPILILLCVVNLADFVRSEYSVESIGQVNLNKHPSRT
ncbi:hypothetical protein [Wolbachia endosymbiont (group E) of Neria commutata]|uniref:hypothetical protein n=1 Tax=Wolbachia endosymbiont (group E) of Neria commutata TaxID=3066149 RepID=UPI003132D848